MLIRREVSETKMIGADGVAFRHNVVLELKLTDQEMDQAYMEQRKYYECIDIMNCIVDFCDKEEIDVETVIGKNGDEKIVDEIYELYDQKRDMEVSQWDAINDAIRTMLEKKGLMG